jgi:hypothetical protein
MGGWSSRDGTVRIANLGTVYDWHRTTLLFYNQRRERFDTASNPCARGLLERGAIKLIAQLVPSMGRTPDLFRRCQMTQRLDYNAASPAGVKALGSVYGHIMQNGHPKALVDMPNARHLPGRRP